VIANYLCRISNFVELTVEFTQQSFRGSEPVGDTIGVINVRLLLKGGASVSNISVTVIPSDQSPLSAKGKRFLS